MFQLKNTKKNKVKSGFSQQHTKWNNTMLLFNLIRKKGSASRIMLAESTGLSATTVSLLVEDLLENSLIRETGIADTNVRGRKPIMLEINGDGGYFVIVELRGKGFICALYDLNARKIDLARYSWERIRAEKITLCRAIGGLLDANGIDCGNLIGINVAYPGVIDTANRCIISSTVLEVSDYITPEDFARVKREWPDALFLVTNTSVVSAYSEYMLYAGIANSTIIEIAINEGIGAGVVVVGEQGECIHSYVMELGHMVIEREGKPCKCGNRGCFEALCGTAAIIRRINEEAGLSLEYEDEYGAEINNESIAGIRAELDRGNERVAAVVRDVAGMVETVLINTVNLINAEYMFLSGNVTDILGEEWISKICRDVNERNVQNKYGKKGIVIQASRLNSDTMRCGAVYMIMNEIFTIGQQEQP